jgi:hypothetical protein
MAAAGWATSQVQREDLLRDSQAPILTDVTPASEAYLYYAPSYVLGILGAVALLIGSVRWALVGHDGKRLLAAPGSAVGAGQPALLQTIADRLLISDAAKRIAYREKDRQALRQAIREDISKGDFEAALVLVNEMSGTYGYREEAENFRDQILKARAADQDRKFTDAIKNLQDLIKRHEWDIAYREAAKIERLFTEHPGAGAGARNLQRQVIEARDQHKHDLEREFLAAAERDDVDRAMELLKVLDKYLTGEEAEPLRETARGVIGKKRDNLGVQFKLAVHDREWTTAVRIGEQIIKEFPNTKMADEVRSRLDLLRDRAAGVQAARPREWAS